MFIQKILYSLVGLGLLLYSSSSAEAAECDPAKVCWGAIAGTLWVDESGQAHARTAVALNHLSRTDAANEAVRMCEEAGGIGCASATEFSGGCGYATVGSKVDDANWFGGGDKEVVLERCNKDGYDCAEPSGGCLKELKE